MARLLAILVGMACLAGAGFAAYWAADPNDQPLEPGVYADEPILPLGELAQGDIKHGMFQLINKHPKAIEILDVYTGCSCHETILSTRTVAPDGRFTLTVKWSVGIRRGPVSDRIGMHYKTVDGERHLIELGLDAHIVPDIHYSPNELVFEPDRPASATVRLSAGRLDSFVIKRVVASQSAFQVMHTPEEADVVVSFDPKNWIVVGSDPWLTIETNSTREPTIRIPLRVKREAPQAMPGGS